MTKLGKALRERFKTPAQALDALGLDAALLSEIDHAGRGARDNNPMNPEGNTMRIATKSLPSRKAMLAQGALVAFLAPRLTGDAQIDLGEVLKGINATNLKRATPNIVKKLVLATDGKLAADADLDEAAELLEQIDRTKTDGAGEIDDKVDTSTAKDGEEEDDPDAEDEEKDDDDKAAKDAEEGEGSGEKADAGQVKAEDEDKEDMVDKKAMDAAIAKVKRDTRREVMAELQAMDEARAAVKPYIGEVSGRVGSASELYRMALDSAIAAGADIDLDGVPASAYPAILKLVPAPGSRGPAKERIASDSAAAKGFAERYPAAAAIRHV